ncbi:dehydrogenase [Marinococcus halophilus]|uniref:NADH-dependent dehydrogenase n=1 Tax=Marinococcus halophilus TaxID=1371 RepID=A0A510Y1N8_MARHA|nr:Gfo/Idh/MocA family oxidoreductase [Marinococcus halophilus]OZT81287.1 dehydrogenase [Marinococcus halophilus]GEK57230.1 NADH-dependent dehydrogenase [Marinococcus halophilus]
MDILQIGIIGAGGIAQGRHIPAFQLIEDAHVAAVFDTDFKKAERAAEAFDIPAVCGTVEELLKQVEAVIICTPNKFHAELAVQALDAGVHVLCEKPMAMTTAECRDMIEASERSGAVLTIGYHYRYMQESRTARQMVQEGEIGDPLVVRLQAMRRRKVPGWGVFTNKDLQGGGSLMDYGCHLLDLSLWLLDDPRPVEVSGRTYDRLSKTPGQINEWGAIDAESFTVEDHVTGYITFENGMTLLLESSWAANIKEDKEELSISGVDGGLQVFPLELYQSKYGSMMSTEPHLTNPEREDVLQAKNFTEACLGLAEIVVKPEQALRVTRIIEAVYESSRTGKSVRLDNVYADEV